MQRKQATNKCLKAKDNYLKIKYMYYNILTITEKANVLDKQQYSVHECNVFL